MGMKRPEKERELVLATLEDDQLVAAKHRLPRRRLGAGARCLLWGLRIYVLAMAVVILYVVLHH